MTFKKWWLVLGCVLFSCFVLSGCGINMRLLKQWQPPFRDARITPVDINGDRISDIVMSGYIKANKKDIAGRAVPDSVVAIDGKSNELLWGYTTQAAVTAYPCIYKDKVFVGSEDRHVYALELKTGNVLWKFKTGGEIQGSASAYNNTVYVGSRDHYVYALNAKTGKLKWKFKTPQAVDTTPGVYQGRVYVASWDRYVYALDAKTGKKIWQFEAESYFSKNNPVLDRGTLYIGNWDKYLYALDAKTGELKWKFKTRGYIHGASPVVHEDTVYMGSEDKYLYALSRTQGKLKWAFETGDALYGSPALSDLGAYFTSRDGYLYAVDFAGTLRWKVKVRGPVKSSPALSHREIWVGSPQVGMVKIYDPFNRIFWPMYGGDPSHRNTTSGAKKAGGQLNQLWSSWTPQRYLQRLKAAFS